MVSEKMYDKLAELAIRKGVNLQKGQPLHIRANVRDIGFVRKVVKEAYEAGAKLVSIDWRDEELSKMNYREVAYEVLKLFLTDYTEEELKSCIAGAYDGKFDTPEIAPFLTFMPL